MIRKLGVALGVILLLSATTMASSHGDKPLVGGCSSDRDCGYGVACHNGV